MLTQQNITALRMERQFLSYKANKQEYCELYRDTQPGHNVYWCGFSDPPSLTFRADFNDIEFNRERQRTRELVKVRFQGDDLGWNENIFIPQKGHSQNYAGKEASLYKRAGRKNNKMSTGNKYKRLSILELTELRILRHDF